MPASLYDVLPPLAHRLIPILKQLSEEVADPECREVAGHSYATLLRIETEAEEVVHDGQKNLEIPTKENLLAKLIEVSGEDGTLRFSWVGSRSVGGLQISGWVADQWVGCRSGMPLSIGGS